MSYLSSRGWFPGLVSCLLAMLASPSAWGQCGGRTGACCIPGGNGTPGCEEPACCDTVCSADPFCCETEWDALCTLEACDLCSTCICEPTTCAATFSGDCFVANGTAYCADLCGEEPCDDCCDTICALDDFCCMVNWDQTCAGQAMTLCVVGGEPCGGDTNDNGVVDVEDLTNVILFWGTDGQGDGVDADLDNDAMVNVNDLTAVILNWGPC